MLNIISITIDTIKMILFFEQKTHSKILLNYHQVLSTFINIIKKNFRLISSMLNIISITIDTIKMILYFEQKTHSKILLNYHQVLSTFINLSNDIVLETKGKIKNITQNELASSYGSIKIIQEIITQFISYIAESSYLEDEIKIKYKELDTLAKEYLEKNLLKLNNMIKEGIYELMNLKKLYLWINTR